MIRFDDVKGYVAMANAAAAEHPTPEAAGRAECEALGIDYDSVQDGLEREAGPLIGPALFGGIVIGVALAKSEQF